jgi:hypothetical protein
MAVYEKPEMVMISGAVNYAGKYVLASKSESLRHVEKGRRFDVKANIEGVKIKRPIQAKQIEAIESINLNLGGQYQK